MEIVVFKNITPHVTHSEVGKQGWGGGQCLRVASKQQQEIER